MWWTIALRFLKRYWLHILVAVVVGSVVLYWQHLERTVDKLTAENKNLVIERDAWKKGFSDLQHGLDEQKKLLEGVAKQGEQLKNDFAKLNSSVNQRIGSINTELGKIKDQDLSGFTDHDAVDYLRKQATKKKEHTQ